MVFDGKDLKVKARPRSGRDLLVVTFTGRDHAPPAANGAAEKFLDGHDISALHFISKANHWWQTPELDTALDLARAYATAEGYAEVVTYGSSMGGFGALAASRRLQARRAVVSVPQYSIDPAVVPWEDRWAKDARQISFIPGDHGRYGEGCEISVLFDPWFEPDLRHVELIESHAPVCRIPVEFAEHDVSRILSDVGMLRDLTLQALRGQYDAGSFLVRLRAARTGSPLVWIGAARQLLRRGKPEWAGRASRKAFALLRAMPDLKLQGEHERLMASHAEVLMALGAERELLQDIDEWMKIRPGGWAEYRMRALAFAALDEGRKAMRNIHRSMRERSPDRGLMTDFLTIYGRFGTAEETATAMDTFRDALIANAPSARRAAELLATKGLEKEARSFAQLVVARYPAEQARLARLL